MNRRMHRFQLQRDESISIKSPPSLQSDLFASDWSSEASLVNYPGLRYLSPWLNVVKKGISPMYMNDPSQTHSSQSPGGETPEDWLIEFRRMKREQKRKSRASKNITPKPKNKQVYFMMPYVINIPNTFTLTPLMIPLCTGHQHQTEFDNNNAERESEWQFQHNRTMFPP